MPIFQIIKNTHFLKIYCTKNKAMFAVYAGNYYFCTYLQT
ncbi:hypothetical protein HMPREF9144_2782 [Prevotella pallens ATCC 700821]|uniref:Uncharacterized protein n=1 Tax=Prevotella pallens ATCC 700821 TaxID=997353 RepID=F9DM90_9BACT|nr:hypothetical protein HMPREF9144_2782 [Prevotella pallens ATCC 700821]